ncbi:SDR family NAD(P)-dependent oxidoreductase [Larkinella terrae]|uniref:SDR family NAD(P)-dependent oxidoreductase n=1 Tax=Larkinella terrae TaxID=2025311 RepID=A0A7K0ELE3_9BACT|nr:SDR family NAD(P)-dependent oxidoreductase [Larkinella terrae]MRS62268.1 SDR family NAD(P)-dependent oxidoreductase [Larkinella terrae]
MRLSNTNKLGLWGLASIGIAVAAKALLDQWRKTDFRGKTVVITGGSRGLGLVLAREFAQEGANLAICARDEAELERAKADLELNGGTVFTYACDITDKTQVTAFIQAVQETVGPVDVLVNNAGTILVTPFEHATEDDFREVMETNFWSAVYAINAVLPQMRARKEMGGRIVNIASFGGKVAFPHLMPYSTSKFALVGYSEGLRPELIKDGIYVTTVCPGLMRTGSPRNALFKGQNEKEYAWFKIGDSLPVLSKSAEESARQILEACRYGRAELIISLPAKVAAAVHGLFPGLTAEVLSVINLLLPAPGGIGEQRVKGKDSETALTRSIFTTKTDDAAEANNQFKW